jgi:hypothetical protein
VAGLFASIALAITGWWFYFKPWVIKVVGSVPSGAVLAFANQCPKEGWREYSDGKGRVIVGAGRGDGLSARVLGDTGGAETHTLTVNEMPEHSHLVAKGRADAGTVGKQLLPYDFHHHLDDWPTEETGGSKPHNNMPPFIVLQYCVKE